MTVPEPVGYYKACFHGLEGIYTRLGFRAILRCGSPTENWNIIIPWALFIELLKTLN